MADNFGARVIVPVEDKDDLWDEIERWRSLCGDKLRAMSFPAKTTKMDAYWDNGAGHASRPSAAELRDFAAAEKFEPLSLQCTVVNAERLHESTIHIELNAKFYANSLEINISGDVKQTVMGLAADLKQYLPEPAAEPVEPATPPAPLPRAVATVPSATPPASHVPWYRTKTFGWIAGPVVFFGIAIPLLVNYLSHVFGWNS